MYTLKSNQYIPAKGPRLQSGMPACATYYYFENEQGKVIDKVSLKPYKGKQMDRYAMHSKAEAQAYLEVINRTNTPPQEYSIGQRFLYHEPLLDRKCEYILATVGKGKVALINLETGNRWHDPQNTGFLNTITCAVWKKVCGGDPSKFTLI